MAGDFGDDPELGIRVTTEADTSGTDAAARGLEDVKGQAGGAAHSLRELVGSSRHAQEIFRGIEGAAHGGAAGIMAMVRGIRGLIVIVSEGIAASGPLGILALVLGTIAGAFLTLTHRAKETGDELGKTAAKADDLKTSMDKAAKAVEDDFKAMVESAKELLAKYEELDRMQKAAEGREDKITQAKRGVARAKLDLEEQNSLAVAAPEDQAHIRDVFEHRRKLATLNEQLEDSQAAVDSADVRAKRAEKESVELSQRELAAQKATSDTEAAAAEAKDQAQRLNKAAIEKPTDEATVKAAREASHKAFVAQAAATAAGTEFEKVQGEVGKGRAKQTEAEGELEQSKRLNEFTKQQVELEKQTLTQVEAGKANEEAAKAARDLAASLEKAAKAADKESGEGEKGGEKKETKGEAERAEADANHLTAQGERALEKLTGGGGVHEKVGKALHETTRALEAVGAHASRLTETAVSTEHAARRNTRKLDDSNRQRVNHDTVTQSP